MTRTRTRLSVSAMPQRLCALLLLCVSAAAAAHAAPPDYAHRRAERAHGLTQPYGWFSLVALESLKPGTDVVVGSAATAKVHLAALPPELMTLRAHDGKVVAVRAAAGVTLAGKPVALNMPLPTGEDDADALAYRGVRFWVIDRGGEKFLRVKDSDAPALVHFHGLRWFAPDAHFVVTADWVPLTTPHTMKVMNKLGQITPVAVPGFVRFKLNGVALELTPMDADDHGLFFVLRDKTAPRETDGGGRFLTTAGPSNGVSRAGTVTLDFNNAVNPPCAYSPYATCPLASPENRLPVRIDAGEKNYE